MKKYNTKNLNIGLVIGGLVLVVGTVTLLAYQNGGSSQQASVSQIYRADDKEKPVLNIEPENRIKDLGTMKVSEERAGAFTLRNTGIKPLVISRIKTSCMCTFGQMIVGDKESPIVNMEMHNSPSAKKWKVELGPGETATARVVYLPALMPVQGPVERSFLFGTNDPLNPTVELTIKAFVEL